MILNKQFLIILLGMFLITKSYSMEKEVMAGRTPEDAAEHYTDFLNFDTDSIVIQRTKTVLSNEDYNKNPVLLAAYGRLVGELIIYKIIEGKDYERFVTFLASIAETPELAKGDANLTLAAKDIQYVFTQSNRMWNKGKKEILEANDVDASVNSFKRNLQIMFLHLQDEKLRMDLAVYKEWMKMSEFISIKFMVKKVCKLMNKKDLVKQEQTKVLELLKQYENQ